jgi:hypothetical protein
MALCGDQRHGPQCKLITCEVSASGRSTKVNITQVQTGKRIDDPARQLQKRTYWPVIEGGSSLPHQITRDLEIVFSRF